MKKALIWGAVIVALILILKHFAKPKQLVTAEGTPVNEAGIIQNTLGQPGGTRVEGIITQSAPAPVLAVVQPKVTANIPQAVAGSNTWNP